MDTQLNAEVPALLRPHSALLDEIPNHKVVVLQLPDRDLPRAPEAFAWLQTQYPDKLFHLACDNCRYECCVDLIAAQHVNATLVAKFGYSCLSERLPVSGTKVAYCLDIKPIDISGFLSSLKSLATSIKDDQVIVAVDSPHLCNLAAIRDACKQTLGNNFMVNSLAAQQDNTHTWHSKEMTDSEGKPVTGDIKGNHTLLFVGREQSFFLTELLLKQQILKVKKLLVCQPDGVMNFIESPLRVELFSKRYMMINKAKSAKVFGIIVVNAWANTAGPSAVKDLLALVNKHGKRAYVFTMNKLNEPKIKNFSEIEIYVVASCPESSFFEYKDFDKIILTPFELAIALEETEWDSSIRFEPPAKIDVVAPVEEFEAMKDRQLVSLEKNREVALASMIGTYDSYTSRTYTGLLQHQEVPVEKASLGKQGIAMSYTPLEQS